MNKEEYDKYYINGSDHYLIPKNVFTELFNEMSSWREESKQLKENWNKLKEELLNLRNLTFTKEFGNEWNNCLSFNNDVLPIINKMQELEGENNG